MLCIGIGAGLLVLAIAGVTIYCCCCHGRKAAKRRFLKEETEFERQRDEINQKHEARLAFLYFELAMFAPSHDPFLLSGFRTYVYREFINV